MEWTSEARRGERRERDEDKEGWAERWLGRWWKWRWELTTAADAALHCVEKSGWQRVSDGEVEECRQEGGVGRRTRCRARQMAAGCIVLERRCGQERRGERRLGDSDVG